MQEEEEEFQEADILWSDSDYGHSKARSLQCLKSNGAIAKKRKESSAMEIKINRADQYQDRYSWTTPGCAYRDTFDMGTNKEGEEEEEEVDGLNAIPPHVLMARRRKKDVVAYSVCVGNGRTLKGRDLRQVRNAVLRMTGFLER